MRVNLPGNLLTRTEINWTFSKVGNLQSDRVNLDTFHATLLAFSLSSILDVVTFQTIKFKYNTFYTIVIGNYTHLIFIKYQSSSLFGQRVSSHRK